MAQEHLDNRNMLMAFWFAKPPFDVAGFAERFGVTAYSYGDAVHLLRWGFRGQKLDLGEFLVIRGISYAELFRAPGFRAHVEMNMGPMVVRGIWYPYISAAPPSVSALASMFTND
jgi:hypothetical protein